MVEVIWMSLTITHSFMPLEMGILRLFVIYWVGRNRDRRSVSVSGVTALMIAAQEGHLNIVNELLVGSKCQRP